MFFRNYTKLIDLASLYNHKFSKRLTSNGDWTCNPRTVTSHVCIHSHALTTELTWQVLSIGQLMVFCAIAENNTRRAKQGVY